MCCNETCLDRSQLEDSEKINVSAMQQYALVRWQALLPSQCLANLDMCLRQGL